MLDAEVRLTVDQAMFSTGIVLATSKLRNLVIALAILCPDCCHRDNLCRPLPDLNRSSTSASANSKTESTSQAKRAGLSFFFTPATFAGRQMETSVRIYNDGEVPILIQSVEITEVLVDHPTPTGVTTHTTGEMHAKADHGPSRLAAGKPDAWSFSLPFPCAPFLLLKLRTTALNEGTGGIEVITFVSGVDAYGGCPEGWEKDW